MKIVYSKPNCPGCVQLKAQYDRDGVTYMEMVIGKDIPLQDFLKKYPEVKSVPFVVEGHDLKWGKDT